MDSVIVTTSPDATHVVLAATQGPTGPRGLTGEQGPQGVQGLKGDTGSQGIQGETGPQGTKGDKGDTGAQGLKGDTGAPGDLTYAQSSQIIGATLPSVRNIYDPAAAVTVGAVKATDGTVDAVGSYRVSAYMPVVAGTNLVCNTAIGTGVYGYAFYNLSKTFVSGIAAVAAGTSVTVPAGAVFARISTVATAVSSVMVLTGSTLPSSYISFGYYDTHTSDTHADSAAQSVVGLMTPASANLFNKDTATLDSILTIATGVVGALAGRYVSDYIPILGATTLCMAVGTTDANSVYGLCYYDATKRLLGGVGLPFTAGQNFAVPSNAAYLRFSGASTSIGSQMLTRGTTPPVPYQPFKPTTTPAMLSPWAGKKLGIWGDSISALNVWQQAVASYHGMTIGFQDARPGRDFAHIFENYAGDPLTSTGATSNGGTTSGTTIAQDLSAIDLCIIALGTNDSGTTIGSLGDAATAPTLYGYIRNAIETIAAANPAMRLVMWAPYQATSRSFATMQAVGTAIKATALNYSVPVIDLLTLSGINQFNWATVLADGLHPNALGMSKCVIPTIAKALQQLG